jgi:hypothetical protein
MFFLSFRNLNELKTTPWLSDFWTALSEQIDRKSAGNNKVVLVWITKEKRNLLNSTQTFAFTFTKQCWLTRWRKLGKADFQIYYSFIYSLDPSIFSHKYFFRTLRYTHSHRINDDQHVIAFLKLHKEEFG